MKYTGTLRYLLVTRWLLIGGMRHWDRADAPGKGLDSLEVEMTSYVLLSLLSGPVMPGFGLDYSSGIVRWLAQQQNSYGGFSSTQVQGTHTYPVDPILHRWLSGKLSTLT